MKTGNFVEAKEKLNNAQEYIKNAHSLQTGIIQGEARGEKYEYSLLFNHAQDTLMTIYSELNIAKQLLGIFDSINDRLTTIENMVNGGAL
jgi:PTS system cellobiose-specific IIA component